MSNAFTNQQSNQDLGLFYLRNPPSGGRTVAVTLSAAGGQANVQCSATTWTGVKGVDLSIANMSADLSGFATSLTLSPASPPPANEIFFGAIHRYMPQGAPLLYLSGTGANASIVDSEVGMGNGTGYGCQSVGFAAWEDCIGTAQLGANGTSLTFSWATSGYATAAGIGLVEETVPGQGPGGSGLILGLPPIVFLALVLVTPIAIVAVAALAWGHRTVIRPPTR